MYAKSQFCILLLVLSVHATAQSVDSAGTYRPTKAGDMRLKIGLPWFNNITSTSPDRINRFGMVGEGASLDYFYTVSRFVELDLSLIGTIDLPVETFGDADILSSWGLGLTHNHLTGRLSLGYGVQFSNYHRVVSKDSVDTRYRHASLGTRLQGYYRFGKTFHVGLIYRPTFYRFDASPTVVYEHSLSIEAAWKFRIRSRKKA